MRILTLEIELGVEVGVLDREPCGALLLSHRDERVDELGVEL